MDDLRETIARIAAEEGIDPAYALAVADQESKFDPSARASKSMRGLYQMSGKLRAKYGVGDSEDPAVQTRGFARFTHDLRQEMTPHLGREPTNSETYLGHYWGGTRAARVARGSHGNLAAADVFTPQEMAQNPQLRRDGTVGSIAKNIMGGFDRRRAKHAESGFGAPDFTQFGQAEAADFTQFGQPEQDNRPLPAGATDLPGNGRIAQAPMSQNPASPDAGNSDMTPPARPGAEVDLSQFGLGETPQPQAMAA